MQCIGSTTEEQRIPEMDSLGQRTVHLPQLEALISHHLVNSPKLYSVGW